jgi:Polyketide cyclase / dehydrase and lipid transport
MSYTATITTTAPPERVLAVLTDPEAIRDWSPVPFQLDHEQALLRTGSETRVTGELAGLRVGFDVRVHAADEDGLRLSATGPVSLDVSYGLRPAAGGSEVCARVSMAGTRGIGGRLVGKATQALLAAGALERAADRIARAAEEALPCAAAA